MAVSQHGQQLRTLSPSFETPAARAPPDERTEGAVAGSLGSSQGTGQ